MRSAFGCAGLGVLLLLVAGTFDAEPLYVTGSALGLLGLGAAAWIGVGGAGATVHRSVERRSVLEDETLTVRVEALAGRLPLPPGYIDEPLLDAPVPIAAGRRRARVRVEASFGRRGRRVLPPPTLVLRDPLGLAERTVRARGPDEVLVLPRTHPVRPIAGGGDASDARARAVLTAAAETEIDGLRPHREGSPASRIHWPAVARGAGLMERRMVAEADARPLVVLDPRGAAALDDADAAVRAAGSLVLHFARRSGCAVLLPGDRRPIVVGPDLGGWASLHVRLAVLDERQGPALGAAQNRRGLVVLVAARRLDRPPRGLARTPGGLLLVVPGELPGRRAVVEVAGCRGYFGTRTGSAGILGAVEA